jgi:hypothetical protein
MVLKDTAHHVGPCFRWDGMVRRMCTRTLLYSFDRGNPAKYLLECEESLIEFSVRGDKVNQHW